MDSDFIHYMFNRSNRLISRKMYIIRIQPQTRIEYLTPDLKLNGKQLLYYLSQITAIFSYYKGKRYGLAWKDSTRKTLIYKETRWRLNRLCSILV